MAHHKQKPAEEESAGEGSPLWMVSFSDCMTLLMSFFLVLATFSASGDKGAYNRSGAGVGNGNSSLSDIKMDNGAVLPKPQLPDQQAQGSETMTPEALAGLVSSGGRANPKDKETYAKKVFMIPSEKLFYGKSDVLTQDGRETLRLIGQYLQSVKARMVISESGVPGAEGGSLGLPRALAILHFFADECGLNVDRMCVSMTGTVPRNQRKAEIALLERSAYR
jgi:flagellar motor protein MotB